MNYKFLKIPKDSENYVLLINRKEFAKWEAGKIILQLEEAGHRFACNVYAKDLEEAIKLISKDESRTKTKRTNNK